jgi:hypothetical protein
MISAQEFACCQTKSRVILAFKLSESHESISSMTGLRYMESWFPEFWVGKLYI